MNRAAHGYFASKSTGIKTRTERGGKGVVIQIKDNEPVYHILPPLKNGVVDIYQLKHWAA